MHHRGGVRITMCAGGRALKDYREKYRNIREISAILSEPQHTTAEALNKYVSDKEKQKLELKTIKRVYAESLADNVSSDGNLVIILDHVGMDELRDFANKAVKHVKGILVALIGSDNDYKYIMASSSIDLRVKAKDINEKLSGRGGGHPQMIQGSLFTDIKTIKKYFEC
jgi:alanyl-tRNA synthetase